jgi:ubiquinone/menaquinone biosynthesis C-methylase UbiE
LGRVDGILGIYSRHIFPRLCDWSMRNPRIERLRKETLSGVRGEILEVGFGTGLNLEHYPEHVHHLTAVDPGEGMSRLARRRIERSEINVDLRVQTAEELPFEDGQFDCVVSTWTLCSIQDARRAVLEISRVLKPGGRFLYMEHGLSDEASVQRWQRRLTPLQKRIAGGCRLDVDIEALVRSGAFGEVNIERFLLDRTPKIAGSMFWGVAVRYVL